MWISIFAALVAASSVASGQEMEATTTKNVAAGMGAVDPKQIAYQQQQQQQKQQQYQQQQQQNEAAYNGAYNLEEEPVYSQAIQNSLGFSQNDFAKVPYPFNLFQKDPFAEQLVGGKEGAVIPPGIDLPPELMELYSKFAHLIPKLAAAHQNNVNQIDYCNPTNPQEGRKYYCRGLGNGYYHDPWNPWCGYIECLNDETFRFRCRNHTFVDLMVKPEMSQKALCRRNLEGMIPWRGQCPNWNEGDICVRAGAVEYGNPPYPDEQGQGGVTVTSSIPTTTTTAP